MNIKTIFGSHELHPHQVSAIEWMIEREESDTIKGGFLCDEMGLGKTITTIGLLLNKPRPKTLILAPIAVLEQWTQTILDMKGPAVYTIVKKGWVYRGGNVLKGRIFITNYDKLTSVSEAFESGTGKYNRIICDEAHVLRSHTNRKTQVLRKVQTDIYWFITGTPIVNGNKDICTLMSFLDPSVKNITKNNLDVEVYNWMEKYALHRSTQIIRSSLKDPEIQVHRLPFTTEKEALFYRGIQGKIANEFDIMMEQERQDGLKKMNLILRLRQISVHPQVYIDSKKKQDASYNRPDWTADSTKTGAVVDILRKDMGSNGYVIFCNFKSEIDILKKRLLQESCVDDVLVYDGSLSEKERNDVLYESKDKMQRVRDLQKVRTVHQTLLPNVPLHITKNIMDYIGQRHVILLAQIQSAGTGLNLQHFNRVIFTTPWWTAALMDQAVGRVLRMGQKDQVVIHSVILEEEERISMNIDDYINEKIENKRLLCQSLLDAANHRV
jgi:SNF2 family DNA or RNA helicase